MFRETWPRVPKLGLSLYAICSRQANVWSLGISCCEQANMPTEFTITSKIEYARLLMCDYSPGLQPRSWYCRLYGSQEFDTGCTGNGRSSCIELKTSISKPILQGIVKCGKGDGEVAQWLQCNANSSGQCCRLVYQRLHYMSSCLCGNACKSSQVIYCKSRTLCPVSRFLSVLL